MANLKNGSYTGAELAAHFYFGEEGKSVIKNKEEFVRRLYRAMFARTPKDSEVRTWTNQNKLRWQYFRSFVGSKEFINICDDCAIDPGSFDGTYLMDMYRDVKSFVERLYNYCLERKTDRSGLISWTCAIAGTISSFHKLKSHSNLETITFVGMGLSVLLAMKPVIDALSTAAFLWVVAEGVCYITGAVFYSINKKKYMHTVFHFFVLAGSICHIIAVWDILMTYV